jgi:hypothetical protein
MVGLSTASAVDGEGGSGEFSLRASGGLSNMWDLSVFVLQPESLTQLCLGAVSGGVKFCLLPGDKCTIAAHSKKVNVEPIHVYINGGGGEFSFHGPTCSHCIIGASFNTYAWRITPSGRLAAYFSKFS